MLRKTKFTFAALLFTASGCGDRYDRILVGGEVYDGRGNPPQVADIGINADRIAAIGDLSAASAGQRTEVSGFAVVPGLVDIHSHAVLGVFRHPLAENYLRQGVTTAVGGPDGGSPLPIGAWLDRFEAEGSAINMGLLVGHGAVRREVVGMEDRRRPKPNSTRCATWWTPRCARGRSVFRPGLTACGETRVSAETGEAPG